MDAGAIIVVGAPVEVIVEAGWVTVEALCVVVTVIKSEM